MDPMQACTIDILMHLPQSVFSDRQLDILIWLLWINNVANVPSVKSMKNLEDMLQSMCGIKSVPHNGALGHKFFLNSLADIIRQVRCSLPQGTCFSLVCSSRRWQTLAYAQPCMYIQKMQVKSWMRPSRQSTGSKIWTLSGLHQWLDYKAKITLYSSQHCWQVAKCACQSVGSIVARVYLQKLGLCNLLLKSLVVDGVLRSLMSLKFCQGTFLFPSKIGMPVQQLVGCLMQPRFLVSIFIVEMW